MNILMRNLALSCFYNYLQKACVSESALVNAFCVKCVCKDDFASTLCKFLMLCLLGLDFKRVANTFWEIKCFL